MGFFTISRHHYTRHSAQAGPAKKNHDSPRLRPALRKENHDSPCLRPALRKEIMTRPGPGLPCERKIMTRPGPGRPCEKEIMTRSAPAALRKKNYNSPPGWPGPGLAWPGWAWLASQIIKKHYVSQYNQQCGMPMLGPL